VTTRVSARGETLREAFAGTALAVLGLAVEPGALEEREVREVRAHGETAEALFASWINECLYVHEVEGFACRRIDFAVFDAAPRAGAEPMRLHSFLHGEEIAPDRHRPRVSLETVSPRAVSVQAVGDGYEISVDV